MKLFALGALLIGSLACVIEVSALQNPDGEEGSACIGDIEVGYRVYGTGYPLVMIMGYGSTMQLWEPALLRTLASRFKVIVFDNRGMGNTESGQKEFSIGQFADDTAGLMEGLGIAQAHVLGWSMGSLIAQELALRHPEKVNRLILYAGHCDASMFPPAPETLQKMTDSSGTPEEQGMRYISVLFPPQWLRSNGQRIREVFYRPMGNIPGESVGRQAMAIGEWNGTTDRLGTIDAPVLLIAGTEDQLVPVRNSQSWPKKSPERNWSSSKTAAMD